MADTEIAQGDFGPKVAVSVSLRNDNNSLYIPDPSSTLTAKLTRRGDGHQIEVACSLTTFYSAQGDEVTWTPQEGETAEPGVYDVQWTETTVDGEPITLPTCAGAKSRIAFTIEICAKP